MFKIGDRVKLKPKGTQNYGMPRVIPEPSRGVIDQMDASAMDKPEFLKKKVWKDITGECTISLKERVAYRSLKEHKIMACFDGVYLIRIGHNNFVKYIGMKADNNLPDYGENNNYRIIMSSLTGDGSGYWFRVEHLEEE